MSFQFRSLKIKSTILWVFFPPSTRQWSLARIWRTTSKKHGVAYRQPKAVLSRLYRNDQPLGTWEVTPTALEMLGLFSLSEIFHYLIWAQVQIQIQGTRTTDSRGSRAMTRSNTDKLTASEWKWAGQILQGWWERVATGEQTVGEGQVGGWDARERGQRRAGGSGWSQSQSDDSNRWKSHRASGGRVETSNEGISGWREAECEKKNDVFALISVVRTCCILNILIYIESFILSASFLPLNLFHLACTLNSRPGVTASLRILLTTASMTTVWKHVEFNLVGVLLLAALPRVSRGSHSQRRHILSCVCVFTAPPNQKLQ